MRHRITIAAAVLSFSFCLAGCDNPVSEPLVSADGVEARGAMYEPMIEEPIDPCYDQIDCCVECCYDCPPQQPQIPPFDPPPAPFATAEVPLIYGGFNWQTQTCNQVAHVKIAFGNDVPRGTTLYVGGVVVKGSYSNVYFYDVNGQLVKTHATQRARDNCVIHHEPEAIGTWDLAPGYYYVYASYWSLTSYGYESTYGYPTGIVGRKIATIRIR